MTDYKPRPKFLRRPTPGWQNVLIALAAGAIIGATLATFI